MDILFLLLSLCAFGWLAGNTLGWAATDRRYRPHGFNWRVFCGNGVYFDWSDRQSGWGKKR